MRFIELLIAATALIVAVKAAPTIEKREMINVEEPFDPKSFIFNPRKLKHATGKRRRGRLNKRAPGCCGNFGLDLNTNLKIGMDGSDPVPAPPAPAPVAPPAPPAPPVPPTSNDHDTIIVNVDNKINH